MNTKLRKRQLKHVLGFKKIPVKTQAKPQAKEERLHLPHKIDNAACKKKKKEPLQKQLQRPQRSGKLANTEVSREFRFQSCIL